LRIPWELPTCSASQASVIDEKAAESFMKDTLKASKPVPRVINVDKNAAYPKAIADLKATGVLSESVELRQIKYLNNLVEQDHRFIKRLVKLILPRICGGVKSSDRLFHKEKKHGQDPKDLHS